MTKEYLKKQVEEKTGENWIEERECPESSRVQKDWSESGHFCQGAIPDKNQTTTITTRGLLSGKFCCITNYLSSN